MCQEVFLNRRLRVIDITVRNFKSVNKIEARSEEIITNKLEGAHIK